MVIWIDAGMSEGITGQGIEVRKAREKMADGKGNFAGPCTPANGMDFRQ